MNYNYFRALNYQKEKKSILVVKRKKKDDQIECLKKKVRSDRESYVVTGLILKFQLYHVNEPTIQLLE